MDHQILTEVPIPLLEWNDSLSVGVPKFDSHHKRLMGLINEYVKAIEAKKSNADLAPMLMGLYEYTKMHFNSEDAFFKEVGFPDAIAHIREHDELAKEVLAYHEKIKNNQDVDSFAVLRFMEDWLIKHINELDKEYSKYYQGESTA
jgi:hemerythrin-like metal-binding protein